MRHSTPGLLLLTPAFWSWLLLLGLSFASFSSAFPQPLTLMSSGLVLGSSYSTLSPSAPFHVYLPGSYTSCPDSSLGCSPLASVHPASQNALDDTHLFTSLPRWNPFRGSPAYRTESLNIHQGRVSSSCTHLGFNKNLIQPSNSFIFQILASCRSAPGSLTKYNS